MHVHDYDTSQRDTSECVRDSIELRRAPKPGGATGLRGLPTTSETYGGLEELAPQESRL
jgi:hypothetical protein